MKQNHQHLSLSHSLSLSPIVQKPTKKALYLGSGFPSNGLKISIKNNNKVSSNLPIIWDATI